MNRKLPPLLALVCAISAPILLIATGRSVRAGGIHDMPLTSIAFARSPIAVDGDLSDWPETRAAPIVPLDAAMIKSDSAALQQLRKHPDSAAFQTAYDASALFLGVEWKGSAPQSSRGVVTFHIATGQVAHIRVETPAGAKRGVVEERIGDAAAWRDISADGGKSVLVAHKDGSATQEIRVPWADLTASHAAPASLTFAIDLQWPDLTSALLRELPVQARHDNTHLTACFLTANSQLFTRGGYLGNSNDWGTLHFVAGPHDNTTQISPLATGATETYVAQAQTPIDLDGKLTEWNPAQFQTASPLPGYLGDRYSAKIATSYDARYLYFAAHVKTIDGPLNTEPEATQAGFSGGDCLQIRLNDGKQTVNLCAWYDSVDKLPALTADGNDLKDPYLLKQGAKEAFVRDADGLGYTQEIAVPWTVLPNGAAPNPGDNWKGSFQVWWAGLNPEFTVVASPTLASSGGMAYTYKLPVESDVTVAVFDAQGHLIRSLVKNGHRRAGLNTEYWDGQDQYGQFVQPGSFQVKGIYHPPISAQPVISIGNPGSPAWPTADGTGDWMSDEMTPQGAATDGVNVYLAAPGSEKGSAIIAVGPDGKRKWGYGEGFSYPRSVALAVQGQYLFALFSGPEYIHATDGSSQNVPVEQAFMICLDKNTGAPALFSSQKPDYTIKTWPFVDKMGGLWDLAKNKTFSPQTYGGQPRYATENIGEPTDAIGIAASGDKLYVSMLSQNQVLVLDAATGHILDTIAVPQPAGLHALPSGTILAVSNGKVVSIDPVSKTITTVIDHDLLAPAHLTTDAAGNIFVSDWGASFQVKEFSATGKFVRAIGKAGGRPWIGPWDPSGMLVPHGVAVTNDGKLWVAEDDTSPSRISVWDTSSGSLIRDYLGPTAYGGGGIFWVDPTDISRIFGQNTLYHVDYAKKTWTPIGTALRRTSLYQPFTPGSMTGLGHQRVIVHNGKQYYFCTYGGMEVTVFRRDGDEFTPVAAMGDIFWPRSHDGTDLGIFDSNLGTHYIANFFPPFFKGHSNQNFVWTDTNNDGEVSADEMTWIQPDHAGPGNSYIPGTCSGLTSYWGYGIGPDGAVYGYGRLGGKTVIGKFSIESWLPNGVPVYSSHPTPVVVRPEADGGMESVHVDDLNHIAITRGYGYEGNDKDCVDFFDQSGNWLWGIAETKAQQPDDVLANGVIGEFKEPGGEDIEASWLWHGNFKPYLFTSDGLYVSYLLDDTQLGPTATWDESYKDYFQAPDGSAYIVNGGKDSYHIDKIVGLDQIHRFNGTIEVTAAALQASQNNAATAAALPPPLPQPVVHVAYLTAAPKIDGDLSAWDMSSAAAMAGSRNRSARVALSRDATNLYVAFDVTGAKFVNKGTDWRTMFISGDCDDIMLHVGQFKPHFSPAEGDERILFSIYQGQPVAVLYRPVVPGTASPAHLMATTIDSIVKLTNAQIAYKRSATGYTLTASVPLKDIGIDPLATETLKGDVGVVFADETGSDRSLRLYYYNKHTSMTADLTTEATLQPGEWGDIEMPLGVNLLKNGDFEQPFSKSADDGWTVTFTRNFGAADLSSDVAYSGGHSLRLTVTSPNTATPDDEKLPEADKWTFINHMNGGKGGSRVEVRQRVPVTPGKSYTIRFHYRAVNIARANDGPGAQRGYASFDTYLAWDGPQGGIVTQRVQGSVPDWHTNFNDRWNYWDVKKPFLVAPGVKSVQLIVSLDDNQTITQPEVFMDDAEMVEMP